MLLIASDCFRLLLVASDYVPSDATRGGAHRSPSTYCPRQRLQLPAAPVPSRLPQAATDCHYFSDRPSRLASATEARPLHYLEWPTPRPSRRLRPFMTLHDLPCPSLRSMAFRDLPLRGPRDGTPRFYAWTPYIRSRSPPTPTSPRCSPTLASLALRCTCASAAPTESASAQAPSSAAPRSRVSSLHGAARDLPWPSTGLPYPSLAFH